MAWLPHHLPFLLIVCLLSAVIAPGETVSLSPSADTCLFELDPEFNLGGQRDVPSGTLGSQVGMTRSRAMYRFDIAGALPASVVITSARLKIDVVRTPDGKRNTTFGLYRILADWGEGNKRGDNPGGAPAEVGEATWAARFHPDVLWSVPGGAFGAEFSVTASAERGIIGNGTYTFEFNATGLADLQTALTAPEVNFGWLLASQAEGQPKSARRWATREHRASPPALEIEFTPSIVPALPVLEIDGAPDAPLVRFDAAAAVTYRIEKTQNLMIWMPMAVVGPLEAPQSVAVPDPDPGSPTYYRLSVADSSALHP